MGVVILRNENSLKNDSSAFNVSNVNVSLRDQVFSILPQFFHWSTGIVKSCLRY